VSEFANLQAALIGIGDGSKEAADQARAIAGAIQNTFDHNWRFGSIIGDKVRGYYCYEWSYAFEDCINSVLYRVPVGERKFGARVQSAAAPPIGVIFVSPIHAWVEIESPQTQKKIYIDDGFWNGSYVHTSPPYGGKYTGFRPGCDVAREECSPPIPYDAEGNPIRDTTVVSKPLPPLFGPKF